MTRYDPLRDPGIYILAAVAIVAGWTTLGLAVAATAYVIVAGRTA